MALSVLTVRIPEVIDDGLAAVSAATGRSIAELTRSALADYLERNVEVFKAQARELTEREAEMRRSAVANLDGLASQVRDLQTANSD